VWAAREAELVPRKPTLTFSGTLGTPRLDVQGAYDQTADAAGNTYDVYVSAKYTGPIYIDGSTDSDNGFWLDRVIPVRESPAGHGPDR